MERFKSAVIVSAVSVSLGAAVLLHAQRGSGGPPAQDPGVRAGSVGAGTPLSTLNSDQVQFFQDGLARFVQVDSVEGGAPGEPGWARAARQRAAVREGVTTAAHTVRSGDAGGGGSSIDLSESE